MAELVLTCCGANRRTEGMGKGKSQGRNVFCGGEEDEEDCCLGFGLSLKERVGVGANSFLFSSKAAVVSKRTDAFSMSAILI